MILMNKAVKISKTTAKLTLKKDLSEMLKNNNKKVKFNSNKAQFLKLEMTIFEEENDIIFLLKIIIILFLR